MERECPSGTETPLQCPKCLACGGRKPREFILGKKLEPQNLHNIRIGIARVQAPCPSVFFVIEMDSSLHAVTAVDGGQGPDPSWSVARRAAYTALANARLRPHAVSFFQHRVPKLLAIIPMAEVRPEV